MDIDDFIKAVGKCEIYKIQSMIKRGIDVNMGDSSGNTALCTAVKTDSFVEYLGKSVKKDPDSSKQVLQMLIDAGANANKASNYGTPLFVAADEGNATAIQMLLNLGVNVNTANKAGETPLSMAVVTGAEEAVKILLDGGATTTGSSLLVIALETLKNPALIKALVEAGADVNAVDEDTKCTPLLMALLMGNQEFIQVLTEAGAVYDPYCKVVAGMKGANSSGIDVNNFYGKDTLLNIAASYGNLSAAQALVRAGANVNEPDGDDTCEDRKRTPLYCAIIGGFSDVAIFLINEGANVNRDSSVNFGCSPLFAAVANNDVDMCRALIAGGARVGDVDKDGWTPLGSAVSEGFTNTARFLINAGADVDKKTPHNDTLVELAWGGIRRCFITDKSKYEQYKEVYKLLRLNGAQGKEYNLVSGIEHFFSHPMRSFKLKKGESRYLIMLQRQRFFNAFNQIADSDEVLSEVAKLAASGHESIPAELIKCMRSGLNFFPGDENDPVNPVFIPRNSQDRRLVSKFLSEYEKEVSNLGKTAEIDPDAPSTSAKTAVAEKVDVSEKTVSLLKNLVSYDAIGTEQTLQRRGSYAENERPRAKQHKSTQTEAEDFKKASLLAKGAVNRA